MHYLISISNFYINFSSSSACSPLYELYAIPCALPYIIFSMNYSSLNSQIICLFFYGILLFISIFLFSVIFGNLIKYSSIYFWEFSVTVLFGSLIFLICCPYLLLLFNYILFFFNLFSFFMIEFFALSPFYY